MKPHIINYLRISTLILALILLSDLNLNAQEFGTLDQQVSNIENTGHQIQVWQVRPGYTKHASYQVKIQHAAPGKVGSFFITAWADTNNDGKPDKEIGRSKLKTAESKGEWSSWSFMSEYKKLYVGNMWEQTDDQMYYQTGGVLKGYEGLSNSVFYSRDFKSVPKQSTGPRYTNIKITAICDIINEIGICNQEVKNIENTGHQVQVWKVDSKYTIPGTYKVKVKHAAAGVEGSFCIIAWTDTNNDGKPDKMIAESELMKAERAGDWSFFEFNSEVENIYVGTKWNHENDKTYYQIGGSVIGYGGLSNTVFYSRTFLGIPNQSVSPRYTNIKVNIRN